MGVEPSDTQLDKLWELFPIFLVEHNDKWLHQYEEIEGSLSELLGEFLVARISHIGSTAVYGIWAKDIVDVLVEFPSGADLGTAAEKLEDSDYRILSNEDKRVSLALGYTSSGFADKVFHIHLRFVGDNDELYFRDYLRAHEEVAHEYQELKLRLWKQHGRDREAYTEAKTGFIQAMTAKAKEEFPGRY